MTTEEMLERISRWQRQARTDEVAIEFLGEIADRLRELQKDRERVDTLERKPGAVAREYHSQKVQYYWAVTHTGDRFNTLREAVDKAKEGQEK